MVDWLVIDSCDGLQELSGLDQLGSVSSGALIRNNPGLRSLRGLAQLTQMGCLAIGGNAVLPDSEIDWLAARTMKDRASIDPAASAFACLP